MSDVVRWAAFSCVLVPVVLLMCGQSFGGAAGTAAGLVALTCACRALLRQSERSASRISAEQAIPHRGRHGRTGGGAHRGGGTLAAVRRVVRPVNDVFVHLHPLLFSQLQAEPQTLA
ncbi:hypothetical protein ACFQ2B_20715 [Streptomyces stramineus]